MLLMKTQIESKPGCIQAALDIIGDKWTALILRDCLGSPKTFSELEISLVSISPRTLSHRLAKLEDEGVLTRVQYNAHPPRFKYQLTPKGKELHSLIKKMADWGASYC